MTAWAPAAWVATLAALVLLGLSRWYDPVPGRVVAVFALVLALAYGEALAGGSVLLPLDNLRADPPFEYLAPTEPRGNHLQGDLLYLVHPSRREARRATAAGEWPLLAPRIGTGLPLIADPQAQALQPLTVIGEGRLPPASGPAAVASLRTLLALTFTFLFLRRLGAGAGPATAGALAFGLGGFLQLWIGWPLANTAALLPAALYALLRADERGAHRDWALLAGTLAALLLAGHPETILYALAVVAAFAVARVRERAPGARRARAGRTAGALLLAGALASPALLPFAEMLPHSLRWTRLTTPARTPGPEELLETSWEEPGALPPAAPVSRLVQSVAPKSLGDSRRSRYWGLRNSNEDAAGFVGTVTLLAALLSFPGWLLGGRLLRHEILGLVLAETAALGMVLPPGFAGLVPELGGSGRLALVLDLGLVVAATGALERFRRGALPEDLRRLGPPAGALLLAAVSVWAYDAYRSPADPETLDAFRHAWVQGHVAAAALGAAVLGFGARRRWGAPAAGVLIAAELLLAHAPANPPMPRRVAFPEPPLVTALREEAGHGPAGARMVAAGSVLRPNLAAVYGLADARVFSPMAPATHVGLLSGAIDHWDGEHAVFDGADHPRLYDRLAVRWIVTGPDEPCPEGTERLFADTTGSLCRRPGAGALLTVGGTGPDGAAISAGGARRSARFRGPVAGRLEATVATVPGWRLLADGLAVPLRPAPEHPGLMVAEVASDRGRIEMLYRPGGFVVGMLLAAAGACLLAAWTLRPPRLPPK